MVSQGIEVKIVGYEHDFWPAIQAANQFNKPPGPGFRFAAIRVSVKNVSRGGEHVPVTASNFRLTAASGTEYLDYKNPCGVIPDPFIFKELSAIGEEAAGNLCWWIPENESGLILIFDPRLSLHVSAQARYLAVGR